MTYYVYLNDKQEGPFEIDTIDRMVREGQISKDTNVWTAGMANWEPADRVPRIAAILTASQSPGATPPTPATPTPPGPPGGPTLGPNLTADPRPVTPGTEPVRRRRRKLSVGQAFGTGLRAALGNPIRIVGLGIVCFVLLVITAAPLIYAAWSLEPAPLQTEQEETAPGEAPALDTEAAEPAIPGAAEEPPLAEPSITTDVLPEPEIATEAPVEPEIAADTPAEPEIAADELAAPAVEDELDALPADPDAAAEGPVDQPVDAEAVAPEAEPELSVLEQQVAEWLEEEQFADFQRFMAGVPVNFEELTNLPTLFWACLAGTVALLSITLGGVSAAMLSAVRRGRAGAGLMLAGIPRLISLILFTIVVGIILAVITGAAVIILTFIEVPALKQAPLDQIVSIVPAIIVAVSLVLGQMVIMDRKGAIGAGGSFRVVMRLGWVRCFIASVPVVILAGVVFKFAICRFVADTHATLETVMEPGGPLDPMRLIDPAVWTPEVLSGLAPSAALLFASGLAFLLMAGVLASMYDQGSPALDRAGA